MLRELYNRGLCFDAPLICGSTWDMRVVLTLIFKEVLDMRVVLTLIFV